MKKVLSVIAAMLMLVGLCGCADKEEPVPSVPISSVSNPSVSDSSVSDAAFSIGGWEGNVYTNDFASLTYTEPEGWSHISAGELIEAQAITSGHAIGSPEFAAEVAGLSGYCALISSNAGGTGTVQHIFENLAVTGDSSMTAEGYLELVLNQLQSQLSGYGYEVAVSPTGTVRLGGSDYLSAAITCRKDGAVAAEQIFAVSKFGQHISSVIISATANAETGKLDFSVEDALACFS